MILITIIRIIDNNHFSGELYIPVTVEIYIYIYLNNSFIPHHRFIVHGSLKAKVSSKRNVKILLLILSMIS